MSLKSTYTAFLANPTAEMLSDTSASLSYIPTLTLLKGTASILKHLSQEAKVLKRRDEKVLSALEADGAVCFEMQTTLEFVAGGGAYLPGLDDNFLTDRIVTFPVVHIVQFDAGRKIQQIRLHWDQGSLLKQVEIIGTRAKVWPICDGKEQARLIASNSNMVAHQLETVVPAVVPAESKDPQEIIISSRIPETGKKNAKPAPRDLHELFVGNDLENSATLPSKGHSFAGGRSGARNLAMESADSMTQLPSKGHSFAGGGSGARNLAMESADSTAQLPSKGHSFAGGKSTLVMPVAGKSGAGKNYQTNRLFDKDAADVENSPPPSPSKQYKSDPKKFEHFEFNEKDEKQVTPKRATARPRTKHNSQWDFDDFNTPQVLPTKVRGQDVRHFGWSDDEEVTIESPGKHPRVAHPRRDADTHFEFRDDGTPTADKQPASRPRGTAHNTGLGLYDSHVFETEEAKEPEKPRPLTNVTNVNAHRKYFDNHFSLSEDSPSAIDKSGVKPVGEDRKKAVQMMDSSWQAYDNSPEVSKKENVVGSHGDGAGGRKGLGRTWGFGDEGEGEGEGLQGGKKQQSHRATGSSLWDF